MSHPMARRMQWQGCDDNGGGWHESDSAAWHQDGDTVCSGRAAILGWPISSARCRPCHQCHHCPLRCTHNRITLHNTDQHTIYCNMPLNATAWKTKSKSLLLISPVGEDMWHDGVSPQSSFSCVHYFNFFQFLNLSEIIVWLLQQAAVPSPSVVLTLQWQHSRLGHNCRRCAALLWWLHVQGGSANMWQCGAGQCRKWFIAGGLRLG